MKSRPLHDRVVLRHVEPEGKATGGIFIPDAVATIGVAAKNAA